MRFFWSLRFLRKGVLFHSIRWTGPQVGSMRFVYPNHRNISENFTHSKSFIFLKRRRIQSKALHTPIAAKRSVSLSPSFTASITVEAAFCLPLFLFFCIQMISLIELFRLHSMIEAALHQEVSRAALWSYAYDTAIPDEMDALASVLESACLKERVIARIGKEKLDHSMIEGGSSGLRVLPTADGEAQDVVDLTICYRVRPVVDILGFSSFEMANRCCMKAWTGYRSEGYGAGGNQEELVYITETGTVYHKSRHCSYLALSIRSAEREEIDGLRNSDGAKYYPCESCGGNGREVFLTEQGNRYHTSLSCSRLKRTVFIVLISETGGRGACSKCCVMG